MKYIIIYAMYGLHVVENNFFSIDLRVNLINSNDRAI